MVNNLAYFALFLYLWCGDWSKAEYFSCEMCVDDADYFSVVGIEHEFENDTLCSGIRIDAPLNSSSLILPPTCQVCQPEGYKYTVNSVGWKLANGTVCGKALLHKKDIVPVEFPVPKESITERVINLN